jgi:hypothetical protein
VGQNSKYEHDNIRAENQGITRPIGLIHQTWHPTKWVFDIALIARYACLTAMWISPDYMPRDKDDGVIGAIELATVWDDPKEDLVIMKDKKRREVARIQRFAASWLDVSISPMVALCFSDVLLRLRPPFNVRMVNLRHYIEHIFFCV